MNIRSIKKRNTSRIHSWIPRSRGAYVTLTNKLQLIRTYGVPSPRTTDIPKQVLFDMVYGPACELSVIRVEETDFSQIVRGTDDVLSAVVISSKKGPA
jgi:hypothetical protein